MLKSIKHIFFDVILLYKKFLNWNIKKTIIYIWSYLFAFVATLPFLLLFFIVAYFLGEDLKEVLINLFNRQDFGNFILSLLFLLVLFVFTLFNSYRYLLLSKFYMNYIDKEDGKIKNNYYLSFKKIKKYVILSLTNCGIILIFFLVLFIIYSIIYYAFGGYEEILKFIAEGNMILFPILTLGVTIIGIFSLIYIIYRIIFSYFFLIDDKDNELKNLKYIKKSIKKTKGFKKFFVFIILNIIFIILFIPANILINLYYENIDNINNYVTYEYGITKEEKENLIINSLVSPSYINSLELEYSNYTIEELENIVRKYQINIIVVQLLNFVLLFGLYTMILTSFYKRELLDK